MSDDTHRLGVDWAQPKSTGDPVYHPSHYTGLRVRTDSGEIGSDNTVDMECRHVMAALLKRKGELLTGYAAYCYGNAIKYIWRAGEKGRTVEDIDKAIRYLQMLKEQLT